MADPSRYDALPVTWLASRTGQPPERIEAMRRAGELIAIEGGPRGDWLVPLWQLDAEGDPLPCVAELVATARRSGIAPERLYDVLRQRSGLGGPRLCG